MKSIDILKSEFERRCRRNPKYSMRSFARDLGISSGSLSELINQKRRLTAKTRTKLARHLPLNREQFRTLHGATIEADAYSRIDDGEFELISEWYYYAILNLSECKGVWTGPEQYASRLGISVVLARIALERLVRMGLLTFGRGGFSRVQQRLATSSDVPSAAIRNFHRQHIEKAAESLNSVPLEERDITSTTFGFDRTRLADAKALLREFRRNFSQLMSDGEKTDVYCLNLQLIPLTTKLEK